MTPLLQPKPDTCFLRCRDRLALFHRAVDGLEYWRAYWAENGARLIELGRRGQLGEYEPLIRRYVDRSQPVLEAGCGPGHFVAALARRGYRAAGVDYEPAVVDVARQSFPELDIRLGNVLALELPDASIGCYLSFGILEHFEDGPLPALREAARVLRPGGSALISVPYLNPGRRRMLESLPPAPPQPDGWTFHQYYFDTQEFNHYLHEAGLRVIAHRAYAVGAFLTREHPAFNRFWQSRWCRDRIKKALRVGFRRAPQGLRRRYGHMMMFVCKRT